MTCTSLEVTSEASPSSPWPYTTGRASPFFTASSGMSQVKLAVSVPLCTGWPAESKVMREPGAPPLSR